WPPEGDGPDFDFESLFPNDGSLIVGSNGSDDPSKEAQFPKDLNFVGNDKDNIIVGLDSADNINGDAGD
mgnify:CR=1